MSIKTLYRVALPFAAATLLLAALLLTLPGRAAAAPTASTELFFSEYVEGSSNNKALEIYNGTGASVDLSTYSIELYFNGSASPGQTIALSGSLLPGDVFVVAHSSASAAVTAVADMTTGSLTFNGDDAVVLKNGTTVVDSIGQVGTDPGSEWGTGDTSTQNNTIRRLATVCQGDTVTSDAFDPALEWVGYPQDTFDGLGTHSATCAATASDLTISKTGTQSAPIGGNLYYTITVSSQGMTATNVVVTDTLPLSVTFDSASMPYTNPAANVYVFSLGSVPSGTQQSIALTVTTSMSATAGQTLTNTAVVSTDAAGDDPANNSASLVSSVYPLVSIHDIQYVPDPASSDASPYSGQTVYVDGLVVAAPGELGSRALVIADPAGGPWSGLYVYDSSSFSGLSLARGDMLRVLGSVTEYYGLTEFVFSSAEVLSSGNAVPTATLVNTGDFVNAASAEQWESALIAFQNATVTDPNLGYGEWAFDDGSGAARADDMGAFTYLPALGDYYDSIRGIGWYAYGNYKLEPRDDADISLGTAPSDLILRKSGPTYALPGDALHYTLTVENQRSITVTGVVVTDTLPLSLTFQSASLTYTNPLSHVYVFSLGDLGPGISTTIQLTATAPMSLTSAQSVVNTAVLTTTTPGDNPANNTATASTTLYPLLSIHDIQYVPDPASSDVSPYANQSVVVEGVVVAAPGEIDVPSRGMVIADAAGGPWSGLWVFQYSGLPAGIQAGDYVRVLGTVQEYYGLTELDPSSGFVQVLSSGNALPAPSVLTTGQFPETTPAMSEQWEGVLVEFRAASVTDENLGYGEWAFDDGSGTARADDLGEKDGDLSYLPHNGEVYNYIRGIGWYSFGNYKLVPRDDADISVHQSAPDISKAAPSNVAAGGILTYTITAGNGLGFDLTNVVITDVVPAGLSSVTPLDGGVYANGMITWTLASLPNNTSAEVHFTATAPLTPALVLVNEDYALRAAEWVTPTFGAPVATVVGDYTPIPLIQGSGMTSPFAGVTVKTRGVVVGFFQGNSSAAGNFNGFFIQDPSGDGDASTSDALFVNYGTTTFSGVAVGDLVEVSGQVQEFSEWDGDACVGDACLTQVAVSTADIAVLGSGTVSPTVLAPLGDPLSSTLYFESLEGMLVTVPNTATVVGPTSYGTIQVVPGSLGIARVMRGSAYEGMPVGVRPDERYGSGAPNLVVGSVVSGVDGPLTYSYGDYLIADQDGYTVVSETLPPESAPSWAAPSPLQFSAATMNTLNFDSADGAVKVSKLVSQVLQMNAPTFLALEEIDAAGVMSDVLAALNVQGYVYDYAFSHPDVGGHGVALLWRTDMVSNVITSTAYQGCSAYGSSSSTYDPLWSTCQSSGMYPLFSRRPVVVTATVQMDSGPQQVVVIANHFKSKLGGASADQRRLEQAQFVHDLVSARESQTPYVLVLGDLNDFEDSAPLQALYAGGVLTNTWYSLPAEQRYSYVHLGVSQILDHILVSPALMDELVAMSPMHFNADYPYNPYTTQPVIWRNSDHDPVVATFQAPYRIFMPVIFKDAP